MTTFTQALSTDAWNRPAIGLDTDIGQLGVLDPADVRRGQLVVCSLAADVAEARELLAMLGLVEGDLPVNGGAEFRAEKNRRRRAVRAAARAAS